MDTTTKIRTILKALEEQFIPDEGYHHSFTFCRDGSDAYGYADLLRLNISINGGCFTINVEEGDLDLPIEEILNQTAVLLGVDDGSVL